MEKANKEIITETLSDLLSIKGMTTEMMRAILMHPNIAIVEVKDPDYDEFQEHVTRHDRRFK